MRVLKFTICLAVLLGGFSFVCRAQKVDAFRESLMAQPARDSLGVASEGVVRIVEHGAFAEAVAKTSNSMAARGMTRGYRVNVYFGNGQSARSEAASVKASFAERFPNIPVYLNYNNPYFKVTAGNCTTSEEANTLLNKVKALYPKAFLVRETVIIGEK